MSSKDLNDIREDPGSFLLFCAGGGLFFGVLFGAAIGIGSCGMKVNRSTMEDCALMCGSQGVESLRQELVIERYRPNNETKVREVGTVYPHCVCHGGRGGADGVEDRTDDGR